MHREENQLNATEWFIALIICSTCFGHLYAQLSSFPHPGHIACCPAPDRRPPATKALHTIHGNNTNIVSSSWWWAYKCPKHVEQIIRAIMHSVASSWFSSLRIYNNAWTNIHQILALIIKPPPTSSLCTKEELTYCTHTSLPVGSFSQLLIIWVPTFRMQAFSAKWWHL